MKVKLGGLCPALKKTALEFAEHTSVHGVSYVAEKKVALSLKLFPSHCNQGSPACQAAVGLCLCSLHVVSHQGLSGRLQPVAEEAGHHHPEEHCQACR